MNWIVAKMKGREKTVAESEVPFNTHRQRSRVTRITINRRMYAEGLLDRPRRHR